MVATVTASAGQPADPLVAAGRRGATAGDGTGAVTDICDRARVRDWLEILQGNSAGLLHLSATDLWAGQAFTSLDLAADWAVAQGDREGVYLRCTSLDPSFRGGGRGTAADSYELPGLWADLDLAGPGHAPPPAPLTLLPDVAAALSLVEALPPPTLWVHSGGGLYPWWLLEEPFVIGAALTETQALSKAWHAYLTAEARSRGWHVAGTGDLARVLRVPGSYNRKEGGQRLCEILLRCGRRYTLPELAYALREVTSSTSAPAVLSIKGHTTAGLIGAGGSAVSQSVSTWLASLPTGPSCDVVNERVQKLISGLVQSNRHASLLGPLMSLARLGQQRHRGVAEAVEQARRAFLTSVEGSRTRNEASNEWDKTLQGAVVAVKTDAALPAHPACACVLSRLQALVGDVRRFSSGVAALNERKVLRYLLMRSVQTNSMLIEESQRQISVAIDVHQPTVSKTIKRLEELGWLQVIPSRREGVPNSYLLVWPPGAAQELSTKSSSTAEYLVDNFVPALVHPLFGADGLGPGVAETFSCLSEKYRRLSNGYLVNVRPGSQAGEGVLHPYSGRSRIPPPSRPLGRGAAVRDLALTSGKTPRTVRKHLARLERLGLAFQDGGHWYRFRFDPQALVTELGIEDTSARKAMEYDRQRLGYYEHLCVDRPNRPAVAAKTVSEGRVIYTHAQTGEELWSRPIDTQREQTA